MSKFDENKIDFLGKKFETLFAILSTPPPMLHAKAEPAILQPVPSGFPASTTTTTTTSAAPGVALQTQWPQTRPMMSQPLQQPSSHPPSTPQQSRPTFS
jgi:hypothetical protein